MAQAYSFLIAGGGIAGLSASIALSMQGHTTKLVERQPHFEEVGAGLQISPNAWRCLRAWGLEKELLEYCSLPSALIARRLQTGQELAQIELGTRSIERYGAPYGTIQRVDLHRMLLARAKQSPLFTLANGFEAVTATAQESSIDVDVHGPHDWRGQAQADAVIAADGVYSQLSSQLFGHGPAMSTGMTAFRCMVKQSALPEQLRSNAVCAWLGKHMHVVTYPVLRGEWLNVVLIVKDTLLQRPSRRGPADMQATLQSITRKAPIYRELQHVFLAIEAHGQSTQGTKWTEWPLSTRKPVRSAQEIVSQRAILMGDAAHPMVPFLAQGAAMAIEDAEQLKNSLALHETDLQAALQHYAETRAVRCAKVQRQSLRNGKIFHLTGLSAFARDCALQWFPAAAMDKSWLYAKGPVPSNRIQSTAPDLSASP